MFRRTEDFPAVRILEDHWQDILAEYSKWHELSFSERFRFRVWRLLNFWRPPAHYGPAEDHAQRSASHTSSGV